MTTERLTELSLLHLHGDIPIDTAAAVDEFGRRHPRRLLLSNIDMYTVFSMGCGRQTPFFSSYPGEKHVLFPYNNVEGYNYT